MQAYAMSFDAEALCVLVSLYSNPAPEAPLLSSCSPNSCYLMPSRLQQHMCRYRALGFSLAACVDALCAETL